MLVEIFTFRLAPGVSDADLRAADATVQTGFYYQQKGIVRRTTARSKDGTWAVVVFWGSEAGADAAGGDDAFDALIDRSTLRVERYETLD